jgi:ubiquinone biosynthesis accessory factor UbiK
MALSGAQLWAMVREACTKKVLLRCKRRSAMDRAQVEKTIQDLLGSLPASLEAARSDLEGHFRRVLQSGARQLDLVSREEFDAQAKVLERSRALIDDLEARVKALEQGRAASGG